MGGNQAGVNLSLYSPNETASGKLGAIQVVASLIDGEPCGGCDFPVFSTSEDGLVLREFLHALSRVVTAAASPPGGLEARVSPKGCVVGSRSEHPPDMD